MPDMPPAFYIPAFGALLAALGTLSAVIKVIWNRNLELADRMAVFNREIVTEVTKAITISSEAISKNSDALDSFSKYAAIEEYRRGKGSSE